MSASQQSYETYDSMISDPSWQDKLLQLNYKLRDALRRHNVQEVLSGNLFYAHLQQHFWETELLKSCDKKRRRLFSLAKNASSYFEVGVNGGHSMFLALSANPNLKCVGVDLCMRMSPNWGPVDIYVEVAMDWLRTSFPDQITFLKGDCLDEIPHFVLSHKDFPVDLVHIDGAKHTYLHDVKNLWPLLHPRTRIVFDDTNIKQCRKALHYLLESGHAVQDPDFPEIHQERLQNSVVRVVKNMVFTSREDLFTYFMRHNLWGGRHSVSGMGSDLSQTQKLIPALMDILRAYKISGLLDIPCGDFHWMASVDLSNIDYIGGDIVGELIQKNKVYERKNIVFQKLDLIDSTLPAADLILCRDGLVHLSISHIFSALRNICKSKSKYLLTTTFTEYTQNKDIRTGQWRPLNLEIAPFNFSKPLTIINERCTEGNGAYADKSMGLWKIEDIRKSLS